MEVKQIVMLAFLVASVPACKMNRCYDDGELREAAERKLRSHYPQPPDPLPTADPDSPPSCPVDQFRSLARDNTNERSLSPWRYVLRPMKDHFPSAYSEAECLCSGCILIQRSGTVPVENFSFNSVPIMQSRVFLRRELCGDGKYRLTPVSRNVAVGCTCVRPTNA